MLEQDIAALDAREPLRLEKLETDICRRECIIATLRRFLASGQIVILGLAVIVSAFIGIAVATHLSTPSLTIEESLVPSHLLLGDKP